MSTPEIKDNEPITIKAFVYECDMGGAKEYRVFNSDRMGDRWYTLIGPVEFAFTIPADFNSVAQKLAHLEREKAAVRAAYQARVAEINEQIGKLQAIEYVEAA